MDWFLYDNGHRHERVKIYSRQLLELMNNFFCLRIGSSTHNFSHQNFELVIDFDSEHIFTS